MRQWLQITSGRGPEECCRVVALVAERILSEAQHSGIQAEILDEVPAERVGNFKSILLALEGETVPEFVTAWAGAIQWTGRSPYRLHHKRKNWFVGVSALKPPEVTDWSKNEVRFETMRASGPGGQHVNKTESAVRAIHIPTGLSVVAREERSQYQNKRLALSRLSDLVRERNEATGDQIQRDLWDQHNALARGNPVRRLVG